MTDALAVALATLIMTIAGLIKQSVQHNDNKDQIDKLKALACVKAPICKDFEPVIDPTIEI